MHAGNQQPFAVPLGQQFDCIGHPRGASGENHDAVGIAGRLQLRDPQLRQKADKSQRRTDKGDGQRGDDQRTQKTARTRRGGRGFRRIMVDMLIHDDAD